MTEQKESLYYITSPLEALPADRQQLVMEAEKAAGRAYAPFSHYGVGAAALLENGQIVSSFNQESVSFPCGICAERALLFQLMNTHRHQRIVSLAVVAVKEGRITDVSPCGLCRQTLTEAENRQQAPLEVIFRAEGRYILIASARQLLPFAFSSV